mmetsp:Transcript_86330/g.126329  ORF Transcript_86330/g.126329 Transcript_86330/m.126329 type:complete len:155 (-) Transcript_86330:53-517(-)
MQTLARQRAESRKSKIKQTLSQYEAAIKQEWSYKAAAAIRGKQHTKGLRAKLQTRFRCLFDAPTDAFVFLDQDAGGTLSTLELQRGCKRIGLDVTIMELGPAVSSDGQVDLLEFLRLFAWVDIAVIEDTLRASRLNVTQIQLLAMERLLHVSHI